MIQYSCISKSIHDFCFVLGVGMYNCLIGGMCVVCVSVTLYHVFVYRMFVLRVGMRGDNRLIGYLHNFCFENGG